MGVDGNGIEYSGDSTILDYRGQVQAGTTPNKHEIISAKVDIAALTAFRQKYPAHLNADVFNLLLKLSFPGNYSTASLSGYK